MQTAVCGEAVRAKEREVPYQGCRLDVLRRRRQGGLGEWGQKSHQVCQFVPEGSLVGHPLT